jgi:hypothetical protein
MPAATQRSMTSRWWVHGVVLVVLGLLPVLLLTHVVPLPAWAGQDVVGVSVVYWLGLVAHAGLSSLGVKLLETRLLGTVAVHAAILLLTVGMVWAVWPTPR